MSSTGNGGAGFHPSSWWALFVSTLVVFLAVINVTSVNVAFPSIREDLGATDAELSWVIGAYNLVVGALLLAAGRLSDSGAKVGLPSGLMQCWVRIS